jgi:hypothetical protein
MSSLDASSVCKAVGQTPSLPSVCSCGHNKEKHLYGKKECCVMTLEKVWCLCIKYKQRAEILGQMERTVEAYVDKRGHLRYRPLKLG